MDSEILSVLIVDDEPLMREELRGYDWTGSGAVLVGEAANGEKALELCGEYPPHVIITDIGMPVMDGLALFRSVRQSYPAIQVILLTCHGDFGYAKEALKLGAVDYIMKVGMQPEDLHQALSKARDNIERQRYYRSSKEEERRWAASVELGRWLHQPERPEAEPNACADTLAEAGLFELPSPLITLHLHAPGELLFIDRMIHHFLIEVEKTGEYGYRFLPVAMGYYLLQPDGRAPDGEEARQRRLEALVCRLREDASLYLSFIGSTIHIFGIVSQPLHSLSQVRRYLLAAADTEAQLFYDSDEPVIHRPEQPLTALTSERAAALAALLNEAAGDKEQLAAALRGPFCEQAAEHRFHPGELRQFLIGWHKTRLPHGNEPQEAAKSPSGMLKAATLEDLVSAAVYELDTQSFQRSKYRAEIEKAIQYMHEHLADPLTLDVVSEQVGYSPRYFSRLFYEETGAGFNDYLTGLRIDRAVRLLQETDSRVYEIANLVGIPSYRYFVKLFRERTGMAPTKIKRS